MPGAETKRARRQAKASAQEAQESANASYQPPDPATFIPYPEALAYGDEEGRERRRLMDAALSEVMRYGASALAAIVANLATSSEYPGLTLGAVRQWREGNQDGFKERLSDAEDVFAARLITGLIDQAEMLPRTSSQRGMLLLAVANNLSDEFSYKGGPKKAKDEGPSELVGSLVTLAQAAEERLKATNGVPF